MVIFWLILFLFFFSRFAHVDLKNPADLDKVLGMNGVEFKGSELTFEKALPFGTPKTPRNGMV